MPLELYAHPFSSYCQKVLIALYADGTEFDFRMLDEKHMENVKELKRHWPIGKFPLLIDGDSSVIETTPIIEHLQAHHGGAHEWIPGGNLGRQVRFLDRFFDLYVMTPMQNIVGNALRPEGAKDPHGVASARETLTTAYEWIEHRLPGEGWAAGDAVSLADCAAAPALFYADWVHPIGEAHPRLKAYRQKLLAFPPYAKAVDEARPYRHLFPLGAPDRD